MKHLTMTGFAIDDLRYEYGLRFSASVSSWTALKWMFNWIWCSRITCELNKISSLAAQALNYFTAHIKKPHWRLIICSTTQRIHSQQVRLLFFLCAVFIPRPECVCLTRWFKELKFPSIYYKSTSNRAENILWLANYARHGRNSFWIFLLFVAW